MKKSFPTHDFEEFCNKIIETENSKLKYYPFSNEIRIKTLSVIEAIRRNLIKITMDDQYNSIEEVLIKQVTNSKWDGFSHTWATIIYDLKNENLIDIIKKRIPIDIHINEDWLSGNNYANKSRYALLSLLNEIPKIKYFDIIPPFRSFYAPIGYETHYSYVARIVDIVLQGFKDIHNIQKIVEKGDIEESYFRDLLKLGLKAYIEKDELKWIEKEHETTSGRKADIFLTRKTCDVPIELKILWRFKEGYEPIKENIDQIRDGEFGLMIVINKPNNPTFKSKYKGFEGWKQYIKDHPTYVPNTLVEKDPQLNLKTHYTVSEHAVSIGTLPKNYTLISFFIDLRYYIRSSDLAKLK